MGKPNTLLLGDPNRRTVFLPFLTQGLANSLLIGCLVRLMVSVTSAGY